MRHQIFIDTTYRLQITAPTSTMSTAVEVGRFIRGLPFDVVRQHPGDNLDEFHYVAVRAGNLKDLVICLRSREAQNRRGISRQ